MVLTTVEEQQENDDNDFAVDGLLFYWQKLI